jgi:L-threonylcarbamoyladenylate synthase
MKVLPNITDPEIIAMLRRGAVGVLPTDTVYGVVTSIGHPSSIERLYQLRQRQSIKGCITLIADAEQIADQLYWQAGDRELMEKYWPGPVSIVLPVSEQTPAYLHPVDATLAFRMPARDDLRTLLEQVGPLFAPSANPANEQPATTLVQAQRYFGDSVDFYVDGGDLSANRPSTLIHQKDGQVEVLRGSLPNS